MAEGRVGGNEEARAPTPRELAWRTRLATAISAGQPLALVLAELARGLDDLRDEHAPRGEHAPFVDWLTSQWHASAVMLQANTDRYQILFEQNPRPMWVYDLETLGFLAVNAAAIAHYGYTRDEFLRMTIKDIRPAEDVARLVEAAGSTIDGEWRGGVTWRHRTKAGRIIHVEISTHSVPFAERRARLVLAADVTDRHVAEQALRASEANLVRAQRIARLGSWELVFETGSLWWSHEVYRIFGLGPSAFDGTYAAFLAAIHPDDRARFEAAQARALAGDAALDVEHRIVRPDGRISWVHEAGELELGEAGHPRRLTGTVHDITERKHTELLLASEARLLEAISTGASLAHVLAEIVTCVETLLPAAIASILLVDPDKPCLRLGVAPRLPEPCRVATEGMPIGPRCNACGTAVHTRETVIIADIASDPRWTYERALALAHGLAACWSMPVIAETGTVVATLAIYLREPGAPTPVELDLCSRMAHIIGIAIERVRKEDERRRAETALAASEHRFRLLSSATSDALWDWEVATDALSWNEGYETLFGYRREDAAPTIASWTDHIHPEDRARVETSLDAVVREGGDVWSDEYRFRHQDGSYVYVLDRGHVMRDPGGTALRVIGGMTDLTERIHAQDKLREQATLLDKAQEAIIVRDLDDRVLYWNRSAERLYGWTAAEAHGRSARELLHRDLAAFRAATDATIAQGEWTGELEKTTKQGTTITIEGRWTLVCDEQGRPKSILAIDTDITQRKSLEAQFLRAQRLESIGTLAGGIAHDLNNVLAPILMNASTLREDEVDPQRIEDLVMIEQCAQRGADMVRQLLAFARGADGRRSKILLGAIAREVRKMAGDTFPKDIALQLDIAPDLWPVDAEATQLHQLLTNLCVNARDAMPDGGTLTITTENTMVDEVYAGMNIEAAVGPYVLLEVADTGTGMPPEVVDRIFEPFFTTKDIGKGTGLGLSTVHSIVRNHQGFIHVYSELGRGTKFKVYLPAAISRDAVHGPAAPSPIPRGNGELLLVIDDEESIRTVAERTLTRYGYRVIVASNGAEGVALYAQHRGEIAAVLTDMMMPIMDGPATIVALKAIDPAVRIIGSSGLNANQNVAKAVGAGVHTFVPKPYTAEVLFKAFRQVLTDVS